ncbi:ceramide-1-phosphate transfer protein [Rhincodon typus]|uniref:ceramide-1-phosphate transfer protein n=1 Tax=Rhincodon typus TaxID=259920 RepID=UPI0009A2A8AF|nr:ceramide-1-phosphate transfer protein [Rhincodon typus]XP_048476097.1 ceramide-1-phosphate transfer protein [Rhincodon typus]XP_048476098.1 ceramide-1-phosphate transfer protein [Rhincodon typus]
MNKEGMKCSKGKILRFLPLVIVLLLLIYLTSVNLSQSHQVNAQKSETEIWENKHHENKHVDVSKSLNSVDKNHKEKCHNSNFQISRVQAAFQACLTKNEDILLKSYLEGWAELQKFIDALGTIFGFISEEVASKMRILIEHQQGVHGKEYTSMRSMINYELTNNVVNFRELPSDRLQSGCRTLLRLHRALRWLQLFLDKLRVSSENDSMPISCAEAYEQSLAKYHSWLVRKAAGIAFLALPVRTDFLKILCLEDNKETKDKLWRAVKLIDRVYNVTQGMYALYNMLELP